jgi:starch phosphorylase
MISDTPGAEDLRRAADALAARIPRPLAPLARLAFNYGWSWELGGEEIFAAVDVHRWHVCRRNPVRLLQEAPVSALERAAANASLLERARAIEKSLASGPLRGAIAGYSREKPIAFVCAEYGIHPSLPIYSGGLGVLAGGILKAASDRRLPLVGVGLLYREGYFRQRIDVSGWQHEYWVETDPDLLPAAMVTHGDDEPLTVSVPIRGRDVVVQIWRIDVGRVPLYLLDTERAENHVMDRWIASRLYVGDRETRLAQYALLGLGGVAALKAMGYEPGLFHLNEGHACLAPIGLAIDAVARGESLEAALAGARRRTVFTTHTPVAAGNETYAFEEVSHVLRELPARLHTTWEPLLEMARTHPHDAGERPGTTQLGLRMSRAANAVSRRHGQVSRAMWRELFGAKSNDEVPIQHVTNGVHVPTWMSRAMRELLAKHLGDGWEERHSDDPMWGRIDAIPDEEVWAVRNSLRAALVDRVRERATLDRLARGEPSEYVERAAQCFDPQRLTIGFARRLATYKRMHLLTIDLDRSLRLLSGDRPVQILLAGKAHPSDEGAKRVVQSLFRAKSLPFVGDRIAYLHDYDLGIARHLVAGCDVWLNLPRPPMEASGTSGMKAALNGGLNLSVLDGWWGEGYDGTNGWSVDGDGDHDEAAQDRRHSQRVLDLLEREVVPLFHRRDDDAVPRGWVKMVKAAIRTAARDFSARRMLGDYVTTMYRSAR